MASAKFVPNGVWRVMLERWRRYIMCILGASLALLSSFPEAFADTKRGRNSVLLFGGPMMQGDFANSFIFPFGSGIDRPIIFGAALQHEYARFENGMSLGVEAGLAGRIGSDLSGEIWGGVSASHVGLSLGSMTISPSLVVGLSAVNQAVGLESQRVGANANRDARLLFYLGPELQFRSASLPGVALVYRIHHRSGAWHTLGNMRGGSNSNVIGLKIDF